MCSRLLYHCISAIRDGRSLWWRHLASDVFSCSFIRLLSSIPHLARWRYCVSIEVSPFLIWWLSEADRWKTVHPSAKVALQERHICGMSTRGWKECRRRRTFLLTHRLITIRYQKKSFFRQIRSFNGKLSGMWNHVSRETTWTRVRGKFCGNRSKESGRSGGSRDKKTTPLRPIFSRSLRTHCMISLKTCKA